MTTTMPLTDAPDVGEGAELDIFEQIYTDARGDRALVPWADEGAQPALVSWLNAVAPGLVRCGSRVAVVGCGLGEDARELMRRGYEVTAFDNSATAVEWARSLDPRNSECYHCEDLFALPGKWRHRFDLVVEINTIQALDPGRRTETMAAIRELLSPHGYLLVICRGAEESDPRKPDSQNSEKWGKSGGGPPWALTEGELGEHAAEAGLVMEGALSSFWDEEEPPVLRMRGLFRRG